MIIVLTTTPCAPSEKSYEDDDRSSADTRTEGDFQCLLVVTSVPA